MILKEISDNDRESNTDTNKIMTMMMFGDSDATFNEDDSDRMVNV